MELILLRHAKAEDFTVAVPDEKRQLTAKGRKRAQAAAKGLRRLIGDSGNLEIWSSHAARSRQTAAIVAEQLGAPPVTEHACIYAGNLENLLGELGRLSADKTVIVVGHEPYLGIWTRQLAEASVPFKKCAAAALHLGPSDLTTGSLRWFAGPKTLAALGFEKE